MWRDYIHLSAVVDDLTLLYVFICDLFRPTPPDDEPSTLERLQFFLSVLSSDAGAKRSSDRTKGRGDGGNRDDFPPHILFPFRLN